jgi:RND family efflux transporter MFP subunit
MEVNSEIKEDARVTHTARESWASVQSKLRNHKPLAFTAALMLLAGLVALFVLSRPKKSSQATTPPTEVEVIKVEQTDVPIYSEWIGTTDGMVNADIRAQVSGYLMRKDYTEGSFVKEGQLLFEIDPRPFQAALAMANGDLARSQGQLGQARSQLDQAVAQVAQANSQLLQAQANVSAAQANQRKTQLDVNKFTPLAEQKAVTQQDLDNAVQANFAAVAQVSAANAGVETAKSQIKAANANVGTAKAAIVAAEAQVQSSLAAVKTAQLNLGFTRIVSPIDGIVGIAVSQVGDLVSPTSGAITTVSTVNPIKVYFTVSEQEYLDYAKRYPTQTERNTAASELELQLFLANGTEYPHKGRFYIADRQVDPTTGAIRLAGVFPNSENTLRPGQYGRVRSAVRTEQGALLIPQRAVTELQGIYRVAVVGNDNKVSIRPVTTGPTSGQMVIVEKGLNPGENIVVEGTQKVKPGITVKPIPYSSTPDANASPEASPGVPDEQ